MPKNTKKKIMKKTSGKKKTTGQKSIEATARRINLKPNSRYINTDGQPQFEESDLLKVENLRLKAVNARQAAINLHQAAEQIEFNAKIEAKAKRNEALVCERLQQKYQDEQSLLFNKLGPKYGIDFKKSTYDDETGIILIMDLEEPEKGEKNPKGKKKEKLKEESEQEPKEEEKESDSSKENTN